MHVNDGMLFGGFMWIFWLLVIAAVVLVIISVINSKSRTENDIKESPLEILKRRYARGEIDEEEYVQRSKLIDS
jgi:putative membrane protein